MLQFITDMSLASAILIVPIALRRVVQVMDLDYFRRVPGHVSTCQQIFWLYSLGVVVALANATYRDMPAAHLPWALSIVAMSLYLLWVQRDAEAEYQRALARDR